ncbi:uncharacterized protein LOC103313712 [Tribolium castaneum]|nr:PREDICTED: uncharacterized protein LOC103313712 [Tribolium castaneum]|eukprot:XP_008195931.1 PREDICTED: uncharacterized protein LOC103313712 [Tribolium castaneum]
MYCKIVVLFYCVLTIGLLPVTFADMEDTSDEGGRYQESKSSQQNESVSAGPPDSHEAMNYRETDLLTRNKRDSLNDDNTENAESIKREQDDSSNVTASELLLELMIKIAAHPEEWNKVHNLLGNINNDILMTEKLLENLQKAKIKPEPAAKSVEKKQKEQVINKTETGEWSDFQTKVKDKLGFLNTLPPDDYHLRNNQYKPFPKTFAYHRVTGRPMYLQKNPKAYIAVSVIAPKYINSGTKDEDLILEKELRQLKPWTHDQNLKNMASIRSRWVIGREDRKKPVVP